MSKTIAQLQADLQKNLDRLVSVLVEQHGFDPHWEIPANMRRFFGAQIDNLYQAWLDTGDIGRTIPRPHPHLGWLFAERAALEARILHRAAGSRSSGTLSPGSNPSADESCRRPPGEELDGSESFAVK
jgi:hypothetical protein